ncbi:MAG: insulinase family protein [Kofleriaceae bacterium]|nr:insulinase family protein [Kofleriaceae bacterium]
MNRLSTSIVTSLALSLSLAACGGGTQSVTQPAPFPTGDTGGTTEPAPPPDPTPKADPMPTQTAGPQELTFPDEAFRAEQPKAGAPRPFNLPAIKTFALSSGVKVYLVEQHTLPIVSVDLSFDGGAAADPKGKRGLSSVCMAMMTEGTVARDKIAYSEALADLASSVSSYAGEDSQGVSMGSLSKHFPATFELFVETLTSPGFRQADLERMIKRRVESIKQAKASPESLANRVSGPVLMGPDHPYGAVTTEASLGAITVDDCKAHHGKWLRPRGARLFVFGDLTEAQIRQAFDGDGLKAWKGTMPKGPAFAGAKTQAGRVFLVDVPGAAQSQISLMHMGPKRTAPDFLANSAMSAILGGGFTSRVNMNLREDKGYSYGARGGFNYGKAYGTFSAGASVRTDSTYQSILELTKEVRALASATTPPTDAELEREKQSAILGLPGRFATGGAALGNFRSLVYYGLPLDYYNTYVDKVGKVTTGQLVASAKKHLKLGQAVYVVVGDGSAKMIERKDGKDVPLMKDGKQLTLREALADLVARGELGRGALVTLDADGRPIK